MRDEHRRRDQRSYSSRRSSTDSSEEGINLNIRDLKVRIGITQWANNFFLIMSILAFEANSTASLS